MLGFMPLSVQRLVFILVEGQCLLADALDGTPGLIALHDVGDARVFLLGLPVFMKGVQDSLLSYRW
jgi:hypothetical protein